MSEKQDKTRIKLKRNEKGKLLPGQPSLNPKGRPKGSKNFTTKVREALAKIADGKSTTREEELIISIINKATGGDSSMAKLIWEQLDGKPVQKNIIANEEGETFKMDVHDEKAVEVVKKFEEEMRRAIIEREE
jgi:hypothetical protein